MGEHEEFLKLAALAAGGELASEERTKLEEHLAICSECRQAQKDFEAVIDHAVPGLISELASDALPQNSSFSQDSAEAAFRKRLSEEDKKSRAVFPPTEPWLSSRVVRRSHGLRRAFDRYHFYMPLAASVLFCLALGVLAFRIGKNRATETSQVEKSSGLVSTRSNEIACERLDQLNAQLAEREKAIVKLKQEIAAKTTETSKLKSSQAEEQARLAAADANQKQWNDERSRMTQELASSREDLAASEKKLQGFERQSAEDAAHASTFEARAAELSRSLAEQRRMNGELQELLAKDRDIRELMGARDLYIAEVHDVLTTGETRKAFGRVFYTKGKSLIFYAYDLSELPGLKAASTFQVWGNRGPDRAQALKLGMFYEDNVSKKRWVMKFNDKKTLDQIDAVFVTIEPPGAASSQVAYP
jgi:hypothetical protein